MRVQTKEGIDNPIIENFRIKHGKAGGEMSRKNIPEFIRSGVLRESFSEEFNYREM